jgi:hypothetical protein
MVETQNKDLDLEGLNSYACILAFNVEKFWGTNLLHLRLQKTKIMLGAEEVYATM